jgi:hypothetical protein
MSRSRSEPCMIWTPECVWLQTYDDAGAMKLSCCGQIELHRVEFFCGSRQLQLFIRIPGRATVINPPHRVCHSQS